MWHVLDKISEQVTKYSTFLGQLWYILVFVFRLIVVITIGGAVYGDEQSAFKCSTDVVGCSNMCYNEFAKVSHIRFWAFQLLFVATPTVMFHFYTLYVNGEIQKLKVEQDRLKAIEEGEAIPGDEKTDKDFRRMSRRRKSLGHVKTRRIYSGNELKEVPYTNKIHYAYFVNIICRIVIEGIFIYLAFLLFLNMIPACRNPLPTPACPERNNPFYFIWMRVPATYACTGEEGSPVYKTCNMHVKLNDMKGYVPCFISRPYEKTVFLCYMSVLSAACFVISVLELFVVLARRLWKNRKPKHRHLRRSYPEEKPRNESVFYSAPPTAPKNQYEDWGHNYPSLGVPVRLVNRYDKPENHSDKIVRINDEDRHSEKELDKENYSDN